jgi:hypothetical protein
MACPFCSIMLKGAQSSANANLEMTDLASWVEARLKTGAERPRDAG